MFYHPEILQRRSGCFGTIWLAATCVSRLQRREVMAVDVPRTCSALAAFVQGLALPRSLAPPLPAEAPPLRCSLYLAALLQLGLTRVYWRQCGALAEEVAAVWGRLHRLHPPPTIDLSPTARLQLLPDAQCAMAALEFAPDPFFGLMEGGPPSPTQLLRILEEPLFLAPTPESITMREAEGAALPPLLEEAELPEPTPEELQFISEAESELLPHLEEIPEEEEEVGGPAVELEVPEEPQLPPEAARPPRPPPTAAPLQIPAAQFRAQLRPTVHCGPMIIPELHPEWRRTPMELFRTPAVGWLPPELWDLWVRAARPIAPEPSEVEGGAGGSGATGRGGASRAPAELRPPEVVGAALPGLSGSVRCWLAAAGAVPPLRTNRHPARPTRPRPPLPQPRPRGMKGAWPRPALFYWTVLGVMAAASSNPCKGAGSGAGKGHRWGTGGCCGSVGQLWVSVGQLWVAMGLYRAVMGRYGSLWGS
ncbi:meiotic recombination protein REC8 homolog isoform X2 [Gallus gallus]|uniref:meiotic recombination protein REC8 homolog isoform X2 n=1 Tax=Gallus gallus TaxID=9031 RepID=UPI001AE261B0|nr:meiotic recombination protein REC8 homolog isoform X2 [Gallus gallus]